MLPPPLRELDDEPELLRDELDDDPELRYELDELDELDELRYELEELDERLDDEELDERDDDVVPPLLLDELPDTVPDERLVLVVLLPLP